MIFFGSTSGGTSGVQVLSPLLEQIAVGPPGGTVWGRSSATGEATVLLDANNQAGLAELKVLSIGGCQLNALDQTISLNTSSGPANLLMEANTGGGPFKISRTRASRRTCEPCRPRRPRRPSTASRQRTTTQWTALRTRWASWPSRSRPRGPWARGSAS